MKQSVSLILTFLAIVAMLSAQSRSDVRGVALGRTGVASSFGVDAVTTNPANLSFFQDATVSFTLSPMGVMAGNTMMSLDDVNYYFGGVRNSDGKLTGRVLNDTERDEFLKKFSKGTIAAQTDLSAAAAVVALDENSAIAFSINTSIQSSVSLPENLGSLIAGYAGFERLEMKNSSASALAYTAYQLSYSSQLSTMQNESTQYSIYAGTSAKLIRGLYYTALDENNSIAVTPFIPQGWDSTKSWAVEMNATRHTSGSIGANSINALSFIGGGEAPGNGMGFDLGATLVVQSQNSSPSYISLALLDLGYVSWTSGQVETIQVKDTIHAAAQVDKQYFDRYQPVKSYESFSTALPTRLRMGGCTQMDHFFSTDRHLRLMAEYTQGFNHLGANTTVPRLGIGAEMTQYEYIPAIRVGAQAGGVEGFLFSAGIGWKIMNTVFLDLSVGSMQAVVSPASAKWFDAAFRLRADI